MFFGKLALLLLALFGGALVVRFLLGLRRFQRRYGEAEEQAAERLRQQLGQPGSLPGSSENPRSR